MGTPASMLNSSMKLPCGNHLVRQTSHVYINRSALLYKGLTMKLLPTLEYAKGLMIYYATRWKEAIKNPFVEKYMPDVKYFLDAFVSD